MSESSVGVAFKKAYAAVVKVFGGKKHNKNSKKNKKEKKKAETKKRSFSADYNYRPPPPVIKETKGKSSDILFPYLFEKGGENKEHVTPGSGARARPTPGLTRTRSKSEPVKWTSFDSGDDWVDENIAMDLTSSSAQVQVDLTTSNTFGDKPFFFPPLSPSSDDPFESALAASSSSVSPPPACDFNSLSSSSCVFRPPAPPSPTFSSALQPQIDYDPLDPFGINQ